MSGKRNGLPVGKPYVYQGSGTELSPAEVVAKLRTDNSPPQPPPDAAAPVIRPVREEVAARVSAALPGAKEKAPDPDPVACFAVHLNARMRLLGWDQQELAARAGVTQITATKAVNGTSVSLEFAGKLATLTGLSLVAMISPYTCATCNGHPPAGFGCLECGTEGERG